MSATWAASAKRRPPAVLTTRPSKTSSSGTWSTCSTVPISSPSDDRTGTPLPRAWYEILLASPSTSGEPEDGADLVQHAPLSATHLLGPKAQEAALLAGIGGRLRRRQQPPAERL